MLSGAYEHILIRKPSIRMWEQHICIQGRCIWMLRAYSAHIAMRSECCRVLKAVAGRVAVCCSVLQCAAARVARLFGLLAPTFRALRHAFFIKGVTRDSYTWAMTHFLRHVYTSFLYVRHCSDNLNFSTHFFACYDPFSLLSNASVERLGVVVKIRRASFDNHRKVCVCVCVCVCV